MRAVGTSARIQCHGSARTARAAQPILKGSPPGATSYMKDAAVADVAVACRPVGMREQNVRKWQETNTGGYLGAQPL